ncbi:MAG: thiamine pyrophosphate-requiring protein [Hyphomicrobiales bacterium]|nr:thiamine pyrophosphate-requiring protein [Hyphomicrobiales bacterium]
MSSIPEQMTAEAYLARLGERGIDYVLANAGTDFAPIVEGISRNTGNVKYPKFITVPHENVAMAMAHGYYRTCGKPAAVMVHVTVGTANTLCGLMNAARDNVPLLLAAGRTPVTETGHIASRNRSIHWGQESFDQGAMVREFVKWDYELREGQPVEAVVDRALDIMMSEPRGPVYLTLPREVLANPAIPARRDTLRPLGTAAPEPARGVIDQAAAMIAKAEFPLIVTSSIGRNPAAVTELAELADAFAIPVVQTEARDFNLPTDHAMHLGFDAGPWIKKADLIIVLDCAIPWIPASGSGPKRDAKIISISSDPLLTRYPFKEIEADLLVQGDPEAALRSLREALDARPRFANGAADARRSAVAIAREESMARRRKLIDTVKDQSPIHLAYLANCLNQLKHKDAIVVSELGVPLAALDMSEPRSFMGNLLSGGLGFGLGAALGAKLAAPHREVIVTVGDGSYMFGNPLPYHYVGRAEGLPTLTIITNNAMWGAVRQSTLDVYPDGEAARANVMPLTQLQPSPDFERVIETCGGYGEKVETAAALMPALERAFEQVRSGTPATLNVMTRPRH